MYIFKFCTKNRIWASIIVTVSLDHQKDILGNFSMNPTYLLKISNTVKPEFCDPYVLRPPAINDHFFWHG